MTRSPMRLAPYLLLLLTVGCATAPPPPPPEAPAVAIEEPPAPEEYLRVFSPKLNFRAGPGLDREKIGFLERWDRLLILSEEDQWFHVRTEDGREGWVHGDFVVKDRPCPPDREEPIVLEEPPVSFVDGASKGTIVVELTVNAEGEITKSAVVENTTGDEAMEVIVLQEARKMRFDPPVYNCEPQPFTTMYRRNF